MKVASVATNSEKMTTEVCCFCLEYTACFCLCDLAQIITAAASARIIAKRKNSLGVAHN